MSSVRPVGRPRKRITNDTVVSIRMPKNHKDMLEEIAEERNMTPAEVIRELIFDVYIGKIKDFGN